MDTPEGTPLDRRRSVLCVPATDARKVAKALASDADEVVVDLEDAVAPERKGVAREVVRGLEADGAGPRLAVRVNPLAGPWGRLDLEAVAQSAATISSIVLPKAEVADDLLGVERELTRRYEGRLDDLPTIQALVETAAGVTGLPDLVRGSRLLEGVIIGYADLAASLGRRAAADPSSWSYVQQAVLLAARSAGIHAVDGPYLGTQDDDGFRAAVRSVADAGFDAKWVIHPQQLAFVNTALAPTPEELSHARRVVEALGDAHDAGAGALSLDGQLVDEAMAVAARRVLARAAHA